LNRKAHSPPRMHRNRTHTQPRITRWL